MINFTVLKNDLKRDEGFRDRPYNDTTGKLTIGYGRNLDKGITRLEADLLLDNDMFEAITEMDRYEWFNALSSARQHGLINMMFNLGSGRFATFKKMIRAFERNHYEQAATEALDSLWARQVGDRATRIVKLIRTGEYDG